MRHIDADTLLAVIDSDLATIKKTMTNEDLEQYLVAFRRMVEDLPTVRLKHIRLEGRDEHHHAR